MKTNDIVSINNNFDTNTDEQLQQYIDAHIKLQTQARTHIGISNETWVGSTGTVISTDDEQRLATVEWHSTLRPASAGSQLASFATRLPYNMLELQYHHAPR